LFRRLEFSRRIRHQCEIAAIQMLRIADGGSNAIVGERNLSFSVGAGNFHAGSGGHVQ
jgi:hypothetical protein